MDRSSGVVLDNYFMGSEMKKEKLSEFLKRHGAEVGDLFVYRNCVNAVMYAYYPVNKNVLAGQADRAFIDNEIISVLCADGKTLRQPIFEFSKEYSLSDIANKLDGEDFSDAIALFAENEAVYSVVEVRDYLDKRIHSLESRLSCQSAWQFKDGKWIEIDLYELMEGK